MQFTPAWQRESHKHVCIGLDRYKGSHLRIARRSVCDWDQESWHLIIPFRCSWSLEFTEVQRTRTLPHPLSIWDQENVDRFILVAHSSSWSLDQLLKGPLITWLHFDPGCKRCYGQRVSDYLLRYKCFFMKPHLFAQQMLSCYSIITSCTCNCGGHGM